MFGITTVRLDSETVVPIFDRERAILELLTQPAHDGVEWAAELLKAHRRDIDIARLTEYARRVDATEQVARVLSGETRAAPLLRS
jgi:hypothetical protein